MYTVTKGLNNNIVMARAEDGRECVLTGSGIGFRKSPGAPVLEQQIEHIYYGLDKLQEKWLYLLGQCSCGIGCFTVYITRGRAARKAPFDTCSTDYNQ